MGKKSLWVAAVVAAGVAAVVLPLAPVGAAPPTQNVTITNTAAEPVPVTGTVNVGSVTGTVPVSGTVNVGSVSGPVPVSGTVNVGSVTGPVPVVPSTPAASASFGIPIQSLPPGANYTFLDSRYAMKATSLTIWTRDLVEFEFSGPAPLVVTTDAPLAIPLTQPNQTGNSVKVTCMSTTASCRFQFWMVGS